jgi:predicted nucleic acid-binding protein
MLLLNQTEDKEETTNQKKDNNSERKKLKDMILAEDMTVVIDPEIIVEMNQEEKDKIETLEETQEDIKDPEDNSLLKVTLSVQQDSFLMSLLMT